MKCDRCGQDVDRGEEREFATLRHMEKVRAEKRDGKIILRLW